MKKSKIVVNIVFALATIVCGMAYAHEGHDHGDENGKPGIITGGKLKGSDGVTYLDVGQSIRLGVIELKQKVTQTGQIVYSSDFSSAVALAGSLKKREFALEAPGGEIFGAFAAETDVSIPDGVEITGPDFSSEMVIDRAKDFSISWMQVPSRKTSFVQIVIETLGADGKEVSARLVVNAKDDGDFTVSSRDLSKLPQGPARIAAKRVEISGVQASQEGVVEKKLFGVKAVSAKIGKARVL